MIANCSAGQKLAGMVDSTMNLGWRLVRAAKAALADPVAAVATMADRICPSARVSGSDSLECVGTFVCVFGNELLGCLLW